MKNYRNLMIGEEGVGLSNAEIKKKVLPYLTNVCTSNGVGPRQQPNGGKEGHGKRRSPMVKRPFPGFMKRRSFKRGGKGNSLIPTHYCNGEILESWNFRGIKSMLSKMKM